MPSLLESAAFGYCGLAMPGYAPHPTALILPSAGGWWSVVVHAN